MTNPSWGGGQRAFCISIDVERDYRTDGMLTTRGINEGLPVFVDKLKSHGLPYDLMISGEVADQVPRDAVRSGSVDCGLGCHGQAHLPGYLNRLDPETQNAHLRRAWQTITSRFGRVPRVFRAPNFSANGETVRILGRLGYLADSSVLPGRRVRRWHLKTLVDHRGVSHSPFLSDPQHYPRPGGDSILVVPVTANPLAPGSPLGFGFLNYGGVEAFSRALNRSEGRYIVFLAHTWEMVGWGGDAPVAPWVRSASRTPSAQLDALLSSLDSWSFTNMDRILERESERRKVAGLQEAHRTIEPEAGPTRSR